MMPDAAEIAGKLTASERIVVLGGVTWSGAQRNRLIAKGVALESCRGEPPLPKRSFYDGCRYRLRLTPLGLLVVAATILAIAPLILLVVCVAVLSSRIDSLAANVSNMQNEIGGVR